MIAVLKQIRSRCTERDLADTVVAGFLLILKADTWTAAFEIFKAWVKVHCLKGIKIIETLCYYAFID